MYYLCSVAIDGAVGETQTPKIQIRCLSEWGNRGILEK